jgi:FtsH-binding integral membrane protein
VTSQKILTIYIAFPCLLYGVFFILALTRYSEMVGADTLRTTHAVFGGYIALILYTKRDQLTAE